jgi:hypothetical protein
MQTAFDLATALDLYRAFTATNPTPEQYARPDMIALKAEADAQYAFERDVALHSNPVAMSAQADTLDADAAYHDEQCAADERGSGVRNEAGNDHAAREFADRAVAHRRLADKARREANVLRAAAARLIERVAA